MCWFSLLKITLVGGTETCLQTVKMCVEDHRSRHRYFFEPNRILCVVRSNSISGRCQRATAESVLLTSNYVVEALMNGSAFSPLSNEAGSSRELFSERYFWHCFHLLSPWPRSVNLRLGLVGNIIWRSSVISKVALIVSYYFLVRIFLIILELL